MPLLKLTANVYLSCGEKAADWLYGKRFSHSGKVRVIRNVINANRFRVNLAIRQSIRQELGIGENTFVVGHVARFCDVKNHKFSVDILKEVLVRVPDATLLLVGDGVLRDEITAHAKRLCVESKVRMVGVVSNVYDYEQAMDVFILPSFYEGLPLSIIEAQVSGLPCFTTEGSVSTECSVTDLVNYIPLESGAKAWADAIINSRNIKRVDRFEQIKAAGYDAASAAKTLQNLYLKLSKKYK